MIVDCAVYKDGRRQDGRLSLEDAYEAGRDDGAWVWLSLREPTRAEFDSVQQEFGLHELAIDDAVSAHQRPKLEIYGDVLFAVFCTASYVDSDEVVDFGEVMVFLGAGFVITVRHGPVSGLAEVRPQLEADPERLGHGPVAVLHSVADRVVGSYVPVLAGVDDDLLELEGQVFAPGQSEATERIYRLTREVLEFHRAAAPLAEPLDRLASETSPLVDQAAHAYFRDVLDRLQRVLDELNGQRALLASMLEANLAQVSQAQTAATLRQNEDMRRISAWVVILAVPTMIAGVYGMNFEHMPELRSPFAYPAVIGVMAAACSLLYWRLRRSGWL